VRVVAQWNARILHVRDVAILLGVPAEHIDHDAATIPYFLVHIDPLHSQEALAFADVNGPWGFTHLPDYEEGEPCGRCLACAESPLAAESRLSPDGDFSSFALGAYIAVAYHWYRTYAVARVTTAPAFAPYLDRQLLILPCPFPELAER
jgi:hypothetical protein